MEYPDQVRQTNYRTLLGEIDQQRKSEPVCFVTFNYDTLLEEAFSSLDIRFVSLDDYVSRNDYRIIKLHGSVSWVREVTAPKENYTDHVVMANHIIANADKIKVSSKYRLVRKESLHPPVSFIASDPVPATCSSCNCDTSGEED